MSCRFVTPMVGVYDYNAYPLFCTPLLSCILPFLHPNDVAMLVSSSVHCHRQWKSIGHGKYLRRVCPEHITLAQFEYMTGSIRLASSIPMSVFSNVALDVVRLAWRFLPRRSDRHRDVCSALAKSGNLKHLQWLYLQTLKGAGEMCMNEFVYHACIKAAGSGHTHILNWLYKTRRTLSVDLVEQMYHAAAKGGHLAPLYWLNMTFDNVHFYSPQLLESAALSGDLKIVRWFGQRTPPPPISPGFCFAAARAGHLHLLQWAYERHRHIFYGLSTTAGAALGGHLEILQWARTRAPPLEWGVCTAGGAAVEGHLHVLQWALEQTPPAPYTWTTLVRAARSGHLHVVVWMVEMQLFSLTDNDWAQLQQVAAEAGHLHIVAWVFTQSPVLSVDHLHKVCNEAAWAGHLHIIQWLYTQKVPSLFWRSLLWAICRRRWHICKWLLCPPPFSPMLNALQWLNYASREGGDGVFRISCFVTLFCCCLWFMGKVLTNIKIK